MTRHKSLASAMSALLAYRNRPEGDPVPVKTNWSLMASNDNEPEVVAEMGYERIQLTTPSVAEIMRQVATNDVERSDPTEMEVIKNGVPHTVCVPGQIVRIGRLRFSNGEQIERGYKVGPGGDVVGTELRMPVGAMLGCQDRPHTPVGGGDNPQEVSASNAYFNEMFGTTPRSRRSAGKGYKRNGPGFTHTAAKAMLADAYANTPDLPPVTRCPPGLPAAGNKIADSFVGMKKAGKGDTGSTAWESIATALVDREIWAEALDELSDRDRQTLDVVVHGRAQNMADIAPGGTDRGSRKRGKRLLIAANDNLANILQKVAS